MEELSREKTLKLFTSFINDGTPFVFTKFGDGEITCMFLCKGGGEHYCNLEIATKLIQAYRFLIRTDNIYLGEWRYNLDLLKVQMVKELGKPNHPVNFDSLLFHENQWLDEPLLSFYQSIKDSNRKKIFIGNRLLSGAKELLDIDVFIPILERDGYDKIDEIHAKLTGVIGHDCMILTACSVVAKMTAHEFYDKTNQFIDLGSALDPLFIGNTRGVGDNSEMAKKYFNGLK